MKKPDKINILIVDDKMKRLIAQNEPFLAVYNAWKADSRQLLPLDDDEARKQSEAIVAKVLANRFPPYPIPGGLYDCLKTSRYWPSTRT